MRLGRQLDFYPFGRKIANAATSFVFTPDQDFTHLILFTMIYLRTVLVT